MSQMNLTTFITYSGTTAKSISKNLTESSDSSEMASFIGIIFIIIIILAISLIKRLWKKRQHEKEMEYWEAEKEKRRIEEARVKAEEKKRRQEELKHKKEQERIKRQTAQAEFECQKEKIDKNFDESYSKLYEFQKRALVDILMLGKKFCILPTGAGKTAVMFNWLKYKEPKRVLIVTTASKRDSGDFEKEADIWCGAGWKESLESFEIISWHKLKAWQEKHAFDSKFYVIAFDEVHYASAGTSSGMGTAFLRVTRNNADWVGFTATPGDTWLKFYPYFVACGLSRNRTSFLKEYAIIQAYKGYPEIIEWRHEATLKAMWRDISTTPDASSVFNELPSEIEKTVHFNKPSGYEKLMRSRISDDGKYLDSTMALCHALRQKCCTKQKLDWIADLVNGLETNAVFFYNYVYEGDRIVETLKKKIPKDAKIWKIDGENHDMPTKASLGPHDMIVAQYSSGSNSLNLQFVHHWVSFSPNYSYTLNIQAKGRIKRIGQQYTMFFYYFRTDDTIEDAIYDCLFNKKDFSEKV